MNHSKDDSLAVRMENQDNDDTIEPTAQYSIDNGEPPHFVRAGDLHQILHRPAGNSVRIKCVASGKLNNINLTSNKLQTKTSLQNNINKNKHQQQ